MFNKILALLEDLPPESKPSYYDRLVSIDKFMQKHNFYAEMYPPQPAVPISVVWAITSRFKEILLQQLGTFVQAGDIFGPEDEVILVANSERGDDLETAKNFVVGAKVKPIIIRRPFPGDGPAPNWDVGAGAAENKRLLFLRDSILFYDPWNLIKYVREVDYQGRLFNFSTILGPIWSRYADRAMYLTHSKYAPNPFLLAFTADRDDVLKVGGFDPVLGRGYDHTGELDFLLRWAMHGLEYVIQDDPTIFHPGLTAESQDELNHMQFQSSINRRYFFDRYGDDFINNLQPPFKSDTSLVEVSHARTFDPLTIVECGGTSLATSTPVKFRKQKVEVVG
jgi:hypothetical protein